MRKELSRFNLILDYILLSQSERKLMHGFRAAHFGYLQWLQQERDRLSAEIENLAASSDGQTQKLQDVHSQKLKALEAQVQGFNMHQLLYCSTRKSNHFFKLFPNRLFNAHLQISDMKKKQENQVQLLKQKQKSEEAAKRLQEEIQYIKAQKVEFLSPSVCPNTSFTFY